MKTIPVIIFLILSFNCFAQNSSPGETKPKTFHIAAHGSFYRDDDTTDATLTAYEAKHIKLDSTTVISFSLVDKDSSITKNWDKFIEKYKDGNYLVVVANSDDGSKGDFMIYFYKQRLNGFDIKKSYELTVNEFQKKYPNLKHYLNIRK